MWSLGLTIRGRLGEEKLIIYKRIINIIVHHTESGHTTSLLTVVMAQDKRSMHRVTV